MSQTERELDLDVDALDEHFSAEATEATEASEAGDAGDAVDADSDAEDVAGADAADGADESDSYELPEIVMATEDDDHDDETASAAMPVRGEPLILGGDAHATTNATTNATADGATGAPADAQADTTARTDTEAEPDTVSDDILDELRQAEIDGPIVHMAPQDDTSSAIRRPRRAADHDPAPFPIAMNVPRVLGRKPRVRRVTRVVRHVDPWSVFKIAAVANLVLYLILLTAGVLLWNVAYATGTVDNVERFFESFGWSSFEFNGGEIYHNAWIAGLFLVVGLTGLAVLIATLFNLITDLVGGMRFTVLEEEVVESRPSPMRRFVVRRAEPEVPAVSYDRSGPIVRDAILDESGQIPR